MSDHRAGLTLVVIALIVPSQGCGSLIKQRVPPANSRPSDLGRRAAPSVFEEVALRDPPLADPSTMIPPPPAMTLPEIPSAPAPKDQFAVVAEPPFATDPGVGHPVGRPAAPGNPANDPMVLPAGGRASVASAAPAAGPAARSSPNPAGEHAQETNLDALRRIHRRALEQFQRMEGFKCRLTRREMVGGKPMPEEVIEYKFRRQPYSLHLKWIGLENQGRELIYVEGAFGGKVQILTGKHEGLLIPAGKRVARLPTDPDIRSKSRFDIREGGMAMSLDWFGRVLRIMEQDPTQGQRLMYLGRKQKRECESGLEAVQERIPPNWEPFLPAGGQRTTYFDPDPASPSYGLPILIVTLNDQGREVEYYWFDQLRPARFSDADFDPDRLWKK